MKLWQFLKRWRQAYLDDKGDRLHAQVQAEKEVQRELERQWNVLTPEERAQFIKKQTTEDRKKEQEVLSYFLFAFQATNEEASSKVFKGFGS